MSAVLMTEGSASLALNAGKGWLPACIRESEREEWEGKIKRGINEDKGKTRG